MATRITPAIDPLPVQTSTDRGNHGRVRRLLTAIPREEPDLDKFTDAVLALAMQRLEENKIGVDAYFTRWHR